MAPLHDTQLNDIQHKLIQNDLIYKSQFVCACISAIEIQNTGLSSMKFGTGILLIGGKVCSRDSITYPNTWGQGGP